MEALNNILTRVSARELSSPYPSKDEMELVYKAALRAPDHAWLRPSTFIEVKDEALDRLSKIFDKFGKSLPDISDEVLNNNLSNIFRLIIVLHLVIIIFWIAGAFIQALHIPALWSLFIFYTGIAVWRFISIAIDGIPESMIIIYLILETLGSMISFWLLKQKK